MVVSIFSRIIAVLLVVFVVLMVALAYSGRNEGSCDPRCFDVTVSVVVIAFGLFGAAASASIGQFSGPRATGTRSLTKLGVAIYLLASFATFIIIPGLASLALFVFIPTGIMMVGMIVLKEFSTDRKKAAVVVGENHFTNQ